MMASKLKHSYQRLKKQSTELATEKQYERVSEHEAVEMVMLSTSSKSNWVRLGGGRYRRRWRKPKIKIAGLRRKVKFFGDKFRVTIMKVLKRLKEGKPFMEELFAGNYMFMQVSPSPTMGQYNYYLDKSYLTEKIKQCQDGHLSSSLIRYNIHKVAY